MVQSRDMPWEVRQYNRYICRGSLHPQATNNYSVNHMNESFHEERLQI